MRFTRYIRKTVQTQARGNPLSCVIIRISTTLPLPCNVDCISVTSERRNVDGVTPSQLHYCRRVTFE